MGKKKTERLVSVDEYRGELLKRGYSVASWAREHDYKPSTVFDAIRGYSNGPTPKKVLAQLNQELGL